AVRGSGLRPQPQRGLPSAAGRCGRRDRGGRAAEDDQRVVDAAEGALGPLELRGKDPGEALADVERMEPGQPAGAGIDLEDRQLSGALAGAEHIAALGLDLERTGGLL